MIYMLRWTKFDCSRSAMQKLQNRTDKESKGVHSGPAVCHINRLKHLQVDNKQEARYPINSPNTSPIAPVIGPQE